MDDAVILEKIESLRRCVQRIESKVPTTPEELKQDPDRQDIIVLNLERAVQLCVDIAARLLADLDAPAPHTMAEGFDALRQAEAIDKETAERMKKAVGFRNVAVHEYTRLDWTIVAVIVTAHLEDFRSFARQVIAWMDCAKG